MVPYKGPYTVTSVCDQADHSTCTSFGGRFGAMSFYRAPPGVFEPEPVLLEARGAP